MPPGELQFMRHFTIDASRDKSRDISVMVTVKTVRLRTVYTVWQAPLFQGIHPNDERALALIALLDDALARFAILQHMTPPPDYPELDMITLRYVCQPFCTLRCAAKMGMSAHKAGYRIVTS